MTAKLFEIGLPVRFGHLSNTDDMAWSLRTNMFWLTYPSPAQLTDAMEKLQQALPETLSGNEMATEAMNATASSGNWSNAKEGI